MESDNNISPPKPFYKKIFRFFSWCFFILVVLAGTGITLAFVYEKEVKAIAIKELNKHLKSEVRIDPANIDLTFISSFPKCAIEFKELVAMEALKKKHKDTLLYARSLSLKFNIKDLFNKRYIIRQIALTNAECFLKVDKNGKPNYIIWETPSADKSQGDSLQFKLQDISIKNLKVSYRNKKSRSKTDFKVETLSFSGNFSESSYELGARGNIYLGILSVDKTDYFKDKKLKLDIELNVNENVYSAKKAELSLNDMFFDLEGNFSYNDSLKNLNLNYRAKNLDIASVLSLLPDKYKTEIKDYKSEGGFFANGKLAYSAEEPFEISSKFGINNATIEYVPQNTRLTNVLVSGELIINKKISQLNLSSISASLNDDKFTGKFLMTDFNDPDLDVSANGTFNLQNINAFWPIDTIVNLEGILKFNGDVKGRLSELKQHTFSDKINVNLLAELTGLKVQFKHDQKEVTVETCRIIARERDVQVEDLKLNRGRSDVELNGKIPGIFNYLFDSRAPLIIEGTLNSNNLNIEDFVYSKGATSAAESEFAIPENVRLILDAEIKNLTFNKFEARNIGGNFELKNQKAMVSDMSFETMEGMALADAFADCSGPTLDVTLQSQIKNIRVQKMFTQLNNFGQSTLIDKNIDGVATATISFSGSWDKKLNPVLNSVTSFADFIIEHGELNDFKPLESLSKFVNLQDLRRIKFSSLNSSLQIKNSVIYIPQTTIKNSALNIDFNGTHTFNNEIDYHIRLLISELLAKKRKQSDDEFGPVENDPENRRSAFILMTGNIDNIVLKYDRKGLKQKVKEDIRQEKKNLKQILREEFGAFKKDSLPPKTPKSEQKFELEKPGNNPPKKTLEPKKKDDDDDDF